MSDPARKYTQVTKAIYERPWALTPSMLAVIEEIVRLRAAGSPFSEKEIEARIAEAANGPRLGGQQAQGVAVIPIYGVITQRMNLMTAMSGGTSVEQITGQFRSALADPDVGAIVFDIDSPGGSVEGITELANEIRAARGQKPMVAVANSLMASAAYWIGSAADEVIASPSAMVGSVGIIAMHVDVSAQDEMVGEKYTFITAGAGKADGNEHEPLSDAARSDLQADVNDYYALFVADVAAGRGLKASVITGDWQAAMFTAKKAQAAGLVDGVATLDASVSRMIGKANGVGRAFGAGLITGALAGMPIHEQLALLNSEGERVAAHYAKRAELRAKEGRAIPATTEEQLAALASLGTIQGDIDPDLDTDQPEEAVPPAVVPVAHEPFEILEAATGGGYRLPPREVPVQ